MLNHIFVHQGLTRFDIAAVLYLSVGHILRRYYRRSIIKVCDIIMVAAQGFHLNGLVGLVHLLLAYQVFGLI